MFPVMRDLRRKNAGITMNDELTFRFANENDCGVILNFIRGLAGIYLEDLFVLPEYRGQGCGKAMLQELARITVERGCGRLEWSCLDWNQPSIDFYLSLGAVQMSDWTAYRLTGETLQKAAQARG